MTHQPKQAASFMVFSMLIIGLIDNYIALIAQDVSLWQFQLFRACMGLPLLALVRLLLLPGVLALLLLLLVVCTAACSL